MTLPTALADLTAACRALVGELRVLLLVLGDAPAELHPVDRLSDVVADLAGWAEEAHAASVAAGDAAGRLDVLTVQRRLAAAQTPITALAERFSAEVVSYDGFTPVAALQRRSGEWQSWVRVVKQGADRCRPLVDGVLDAQCRSWQELADRAPVGPVYVRTPGRTG